MSPVELLFKRLSEVQDQLSRLPNDAFAERAALLAERDDLRRRAERHAEGADLERPTEDLRHELAVLQREWSRMSPSDAEAVRLAARVNRLIAILGEREAGSSRSWQGSLERAQ